MGISSSRSSVSSNKEKNSNSISDSEKIKLLAPKDACCDDSDENYECCICFVNYFAINHTICCNERICTSCYLLISSRNQASRGKILIPKGIHCPFCSKLTLEVIYRARKKDDLRNSETKQSEEIAAEDSTGVKSSPPKIPSKKGTLDIPLSTIADRKQIENEIKSQHCLFKTNLPMGNNSTKMLHNNSSALISQHRNNSSSNYNESNTKNVDNNSPFAESLHHLLSNGNVSDFDKIDELILEETIKMSLNELNTNTVISGKNFDNVKFPPVPPSESLLAMDNLSEEEQLELAIALSQINQNEK